MVPWVDHSKTTLKKGYEGHKNYQRFSPKKRKIDLILAKLLVMIRLIENTNRFSGCCEAHFLTIQRVQERTKIILST